MKKLLIIVLCTMAGIAGWSQSESMFANGQGLHDCWVEYQKLLSADVELGSTESLQVGFFFGYIKGIADVRARIGLFSIPEDAQLGQICAVVGKYLEAHPEEWNRTGSYLVVKALSTTWPRKK